MFSEFLTSAAIARQVSKRDGIVSYGRAHVLVYVSGRVEREGSVILLLIARNPTTCIYQVFLLSVGGGGIPLYIPNFLQLFYLRGKGLGVRE